MSVNNSKKCPPLVLAPMAGFTDAAFRLMCYEGGADICISEMISSKAMTYKDRKTADLATLKKGEKNTLIQLFGHDPRDMADAAEMIEKGDFEGCRYEEKPAGIDINMGCPVKKIALSGDGSALMKSPALCAEIVYGIKERVSLPVSVKIRAGWDSRSKNAVEVAVACADAGVDRIYVHGRTREDMYIDGTVDIDIIARVRDAVDSRVEVFANGDIMNGESAGIMLEKTACDGLMIGREALGNPWIFNEIRAFLSGEEYAMPTREDRIAAAINLVRSVVLEKGEDKGIREARGRAAHFIRGMRGSAEMRGELNQAKSLSHFVSLLERFANE